MKTKYVVPKSLSLCFSAIVGMETRRSRESFIYITFGCIFGIVGVFWVSYCIGQWWRSNHPCQYLDRPFFGHPHLTSLDSFSRFWFGFVFWKGPTESIPVSKIYIFLFLCECFRTCIQKNLFVRSVKGNVLTLFTI